MIHIQFIIKSNSESFSNYQKTLKIPKVLEILVYVYFGKFDYIFRWLKIKVFVFYYPFNDNINLLAIATIVMT